MLAGGAELEALVLRVAVGRYPEGAAAEGGAVVAVGARTVSYTHLTLPTSSYV